MPRSASTSPSTSTRRGKLLVYPVRAIAGPIAGHHPDARRSPDSDRHLRVASRTAPATGYDTISVKTSAPGTVMAVELIQQTSLSCVYSLNGSAMYAKFVVDSVNLPSRRLFVRHVIDGNCGFRSLVPDSIPTF